MDIDKLKLSLKQFAEERDWEQFHSPKNLSMALAGEAGELLEIFQWLSEDESKNLDLIKLKSVKEELADIQIYLIRLADKLAIDIEQSVLEKIEINKQKYPIDRVKGKSKKYTDYI